MNVQQLHLFQRIRMNGGTIQHLEAKLKINIYGEKVNIPKIIRNSY